MEHKALALLVFAMLCGCAGSPAAVVGDSGAGAQTISKSDLLYVSDRTAGNVRFFAYPAGRLAGTLPGLTRPEAVCADEAGHVWVGTYGDVFEYEHGAKSPTLVLNGLKHAVSGCSVDPTTGNLAAVTYGAAKSENGVFVFAGGRGKPTVYKSAAFTDYFSCAYDSFGNLFVSGHLHKHLPNNLLAELPAGGSQLKTIKLKHSFPGQSAVQWDGTYLALVHYGRLYRFVIEGSAGKQIGESTLAGGERVKQFVIYGQPSTSQRTLIAPLTTSGGDVLYWDYPNGGTATGKLPYNKFGYPYGVAISAGK